MKVITFASMKGGSGKTSACLALAEGLTDRGYNVLGVDTDAQCNFTDTTGLDVLDMDNTLYDAMRGRTSVNDAVYHSDLHLDVLTAGFEAVNSDFDFNVRNDLFRLRDTITGLSGYDYILIDTSPHLGYMTRAAIVAADTIIIPLTVDKYAIRGAEQLYAMIQNLREDYKVHPEIAGILLNMYNSRTNLTKDLSGYIQEMAADMNSKVYSTVIRQSQAVKDSQAYQMSIYDIRSNAKQDYNSFVDEVINDLERKERA